MKDNYINTISYIYLLLMLIGVSVISCDDYLDRKPLSDVTPSDYLWTEADLAAYAVGQYSFPSHSGWGPGVFSYDNHTDNQASSSYSNRWVPGEWRVPQSGGDGILFRFVIAIIFSKLLFLDGKKEK